MTWEKKIEQYHTWTEERDQGFVTVIKNNELITLRFTPSECERILKRSHSEYESIPFTFMVRLKLIWKLLWLKVEKKEEEPEEI